MILGMDVLRWLTVKSLRGRTWAEMRVFDAPVQPTDLRVEDDRNAFISVYVDDASIKMDGNSLNAGDALCTLIIEVAVADVTSITPDVGDRDVTDPDIDRPPSMPRTVRLAQTDEGLEATIGFVSNQCAQALLAGDNPWAELWRQMTLQRKDVEIRRGGPSMEGKPEPAVRFASRVSRLRVSIVADPIWGESLEPGGFWWNFLAAAEADSEIGELAKIVRAHIEFPGAAIPYWRIQQAIGMYTTQGVARLGIAPVIGEDAFMPDIAEPAIGEKGTSHDIDSDKRLDIVKIEDDEWEPELPPGEPEEPKPILPDIEKSEWEEEGAP